MNNNDTIIKFVIDGYENFKKTDILHDGRKFVLKNKTDNFISLPPKGFQYHRWAQSLKSSQAFAYNVFSGVKNVKIQFEFPLEVFDRDAQIDVMLQDLNSKNIKLYEVKAFEICNLGRNKIKFKDKYFDLTKYKRDDIAKKFIDFLSSVINHFENKKIYGGGVKQLCSHLLGILNIMDEPEYLNKKFLLYSFCFDYTISDTFEKHIKNYQDVLFDFKQLVDEFLRSIKVEERIEYCGFLSAKDFLTKNQELLGKENYDYVMKRYFFKNIEQ
ncbi:MAG: hypothetical protein COW66_13225 [Flavobacteriaceae bacterium CG18_big_fil_WC_8_21_14_2_50_34_36]|nr:hypothetical protein [Flavobacteriia bacterium]NCT17909.1 hypothetical protein [Flavobacteriia bacterium]PIQ17172.1 MAG: hypothetical protein COW66_13225 [Flavobacteriaceae bacterium CG18_big_fil_WC_8_21_14_2_50_34_36]